MADFSVYSIDKYLDGGSSSRPAHPGQRLVHVHDGVDTTYCYSLSLTDPDQSMEAFTEWCDTVFTEFGEPIHTIRVEAQPS